MSDQDHNAVTAADASHIDPHASVATTGHPVVRYNPDAPSEQWGWHGDWRDMAPKTTAFVLWLCVFTLFMYTWTNHQSHVEDFYFDGIALLLAIWLVTRTVSHRRAKRRAAAPPR